MMQHHEETADSWGLAVVRGDMISPDLQVRPPAISNGNTNKSLKIHTVSFGAITYFY
jgi:hypothetical protein